MRFLLGVLQALFVGAIFVTNKFEKKWNVIGAALVANALHPGVLLIVDRLGIVGRVVEQNLYAVRASFLQSERRPVVEQIRQTARPSLVIPGFLVRQQQASIFRATLGGWKTPFGIEQNRGGVRRQNFAHQYLELFHHGVVDVRALLFGQRFLQRAALVHCCGGNHTSLVGYT